MAPKALLALGVLMVGLLIISSEVAAREMAETAKEGQTKGDVEDQYGGHCRYGCCGGWYHGRCRRSCAHETEVPDAAAEDALTDQYGYRCHYGCCGGWYYGRCRRCCTNKSEATAAKTEAKPDN